MRRNIRTPSLEPAERAAEGRQDTRLVQVGMEEAGMGAPIENDIQQQCNKGAGQEHGEERQLSVKQIQELSRQGMLMSADICTHENTRVYFLSLGFG